MAGHAPEVILSYCFNWDGGGQERDTAMAAIRAARSDAKVVVQGGDGYPVQVVVKDKASGSVLWSGAQRRLFRKYADERSKSIAEITAAVKAAFPQ